VPLAAHSVSGENRRGSAKLQSTGFSIDAPHAPARQHTWDADPASGGYKIGNPFSPDRQEIW